MTKPPLRISAVSYINAIPFIYGIERSGFLKNYSLSLDVPSVCAQKLISGQVDIGLAPVAIIPQLKEHYILPDFCIGADGAVSSVMLYSEVPLGEIKQIYLDHQSRTSVMLVQVLAEFFWKIKPEFIAAEKGYEEKIKGAIAGLIIGDRNFSIGRKFSHTYDLSEQWKLFSGLPFVFACWISNKKLEVLQARDLHSAFAFGLEHKQEALKELNTQLDRGMIAAYLDQYISYKLDASKRSAMDLFLQLGRKFA